MRAGWLGKKFKPPWLEGEQSGVSTQIKMTVVSRLSCCQAVFTQSLEQAEQQREREKSRARSELSSDLLVGHVSAARPVIGQTYRLTVGPSKFQLVR